MRREEGKEGGRREEYRESARREDFKEPARREEYKESGGGRREERSREESGKEGGGCRREDHKVITDQSDKIIFVQFPNTVIMIKPNDRIAEGRIIRSQRMGAL